MRKTVQIEVPTTWKDINLKQYLALMSDLENYKEDEEAQTALMLHHLCGLDAHQIQAVSKDGYDLLRQKLGSFIQPDGIPLQKFITIDGVEYGFEPNLSKMSYGAYADITQYETITIDKNWGKIMSILYRPVTKKVGDTYSIKEYEGNIDETLWLKQNMELHWGALFFFVHLQMDLLKGILKSLKAEELHPSIKSVLEKSGELMQQSWNSQMVTFLK